MEKEQSTENTIEQIFSKKLADVHKEDKPFVKSRKDIFSDEQTNVTRESLDYTKYLNELADRTKNKKPVQLPEVQEYYPKNTTSAIIDKTIESPKPVIQKIVDSNKRHDDQSREIAIYQQIISAMKNELTEYKNKFSIIAPKIMQYEQNINSLRAEILEYRNRMELMISERNQQSSVDSLRAELVEHRNRIRTTPPSHSAKDEDLSSLGAQISRLKRNLDLIIPK